jgi:hypothetical protein
MAQGYIHTSPEPMRFPARRAASAGADHVIVEEPRAQVKEVAVGSNGITSVLLHFDTGIR